MIKHKGLIITLLCINALLTVILIYSSFQVQPTETMTPQAPEQLTEISNDLLLTTLQPHIELVIAGHYKNINGYGVSISPFMMEVIDLKRVGEGRTFTFIVTVKVIPYTGANIPLGEDNLTFEINNGIIRLTDFQQVIDFPSADYQIPQ